MTMGIVLVTVLSKAAVDHLMVGFIKNGVKVERPLNGEIFYDASPYLTGVFRVESKLSLNDLRNMAVSIMKDSGYMCINCIVVNGGCSWTMGMVSEPKPSSEKPLQR